MSFKKKSRQSWPHYLKKKNGCVWWCMHHLCLKKCQSSTSGSHWEKGKSRKIFLNTLWDRVLALDCKFPKSILHLRKTYTPRWPTSILPTLIWLWSGVCSPLLSFELWSVLCFNRIWTLWKPGTTPTRWKDNVNFLLISHWPQAAFKANLCFRAVYIYSWSWS